jgi:hypothetical protein
MATIARLAVGGLPARSAMMTTRRRRHGDEFKAKRPSFGPAIPSSSHAGRPSAAS